MILSVPCEITKNSAGQLGKQAALCYLYRLLRKQRRYFDVSKKFDYIKKFQCNTNHYIISDSNIEKLLILGKNSAQKICAAFFRPIWYSLGCFFGRDSREMFSYCSLTILYQQRGSHRRLGNAHSARDDLVEASCVSFASVQARKLNHYAASPLPTKPSGFAGSPRRASEKRTVGSPGRLHHAAQSVWTHNV